MEKIEHPTWEGLYEKVTETTKGREGKDFNYREWKKTQPRTFTEMFDGPNQEKLKENRTYEEIYSKHLKEISWEGHAWERNPYEREDSDGTYFRGCDCEIDWDNDPEASEAFDRGDDMCPACFKNKDDERAQRGNKFYKNMKDLMGDRLPDTFMKWFGLQMAGATTDIAYADPAKNVERIAKQYKLNNDECKKLFQFFHDNGISSANAGRPSRQRHTFYESKLKEENSYDDELQDFISSDEMSAFIEETGADIESTDQQLKNGTVEFIFPQGYIVHISKAGYVRMMNLSGDGTRILNRNGKVDYYEGLDIILNFYRRNLEKYRDTPAKHHRGCSFMDWQDKIVNKRNDRAAAARRRHGLQESIEHCSKCGDGPINTDYDVGDRGDYFNDVYYCMRCMPEEYFFGRDEEPVSEGDIVKIPWVECFDNDGDWDKYINDGKYSLMKIEQIDNGCAYGYIEKANGDPDVNDGDEVYEIFLPHNCKPVRLNETAYKCKKCGKPVLKDGDGKCSHCGKQHKLSESFRF